MRRYNINSAQHFFQAIRPHVAKALYECILERHMLSENKKNDKKSKKDSVDMDKLVKKLMKNEDFKTKAIQFLTDEDAMDSWVDELGGQTYTALSNLSDGAKRRIVTLRLKDKKIDWAPLAYKLWPHMTEDAARSWFSKKVAGKNAKFSDEELSELYGLLNNTVK